MLISSHCDFLFCSPFSHHSANSCITASSLSFISLFPLGLLSQLWLVLQAVLLELQYLIKKLLHSHFLGCLFGDICKDKCTLIMECWTFKFLNLFLGRKGQRLSSLVLEGIKFVPLTTEFPSILFLLFHTTQAQDI